MLDAVICDEVYERSGGLRIRSGAFVLSLDCPRRDCEELLEMEAPMVVFCHLESRDEELRLAGFASEERRDLYLALRAVPDIGRHSALLAMDCGEASDILRAVAGHDRDFFRGIPGLGPKRIEAILKHLRRTYDGGLPEPIRGVPTSWLVEAREALVSNGHPATDAELAVLRVLERERPADVEELVQRALEEG